MSGMNSGPLLCSTVMSLATVLFLGASKGLACVSWGSGTAAIGTVALQSANCQLLQRNLETTQNVAAVAVLA